MAKKKEMSILPDVQTTLVQKEKLAGAQNPNLQEHTIPTADSLLPKTGTASGTAEMRVNQQREEPGCMVGLRSRGC